MRSKKEETKENPSKKRKKVYTSPKAICTKISLGIWAGSCTGSCLSPTTLIATPTGNKKVSSIKPGDIVWTTNKNNSKQSTSVIKISKTKVPSTHHMIDLILSDKRSLVASPDHPLNDEKNIRQLFTGERYDGAKVMKIALIPYDHDYTYDILPDGDTGFYWANNILIGSTLMYKENHHPLINVFSHIQLL